MLCRNPFHIMVFNIHHKTRSLFLTLIIEKDETTVSQMGTKDWDLITQLILANIHPEDTVCHFTPRTGKRRGTHDITVQTGEEFVDQFMRLALAHSDGYKMSITLYDAIGPLSMESTFNKKVLFLMERYSYRNETQFVNERIAPLVHITNQGGE